ncbi:MAG: hypothetical protein COX90_04385 [Candidatus Nealsonbacteria bacterium CG_4_10_14_0_2_um_filter_38_17]|uniref:Uncharacterized protein n=1 Tax=Candidatus Nealsonbacteria bacterium CG_4_10_14_0_2_um_filter_38_17 TaxID=1974680 RepID=A0A2M7UX21_9BACT|nr:MAG: hypothetical protein COX90_04385 [Candidatus Nealsonbacteria bacterium CG_4_10_14_0_2_um_filter_38_17]
MNRSRGAPEASPLSERKAAAAQLGLSGSRAAIPSRSKAVAGRQTLLQQSSAIGSLPTNGL